MSNLCCPHCRLRFTPAAAASLAACPECGKPPQPSSLEGTVGYRVFRLEDVPYPVPKAVAVSLPVPERPV